MVAGIKEHRAIQIFHNWFGDDLRELCTDMGMTMTTAFTVFAKKAVREYRIPFEIGAEVPNAVTRKAIEDAKNGIGMSKGFSSVKEEREYAKSCWIFQ